MSSDARLLHDYYQALGMSSNASNACSSRASSRSHLNVQGPGRGTIPKLSAMRSSMLLSDLSEARKEVGGPSEIAVLSRLMTDHMVLPCLRTSIQPAGRSPEHAVCSRIASSPSSVFSGPSLPGRMANWCCSRSTVAGGFRECVAKGRLIPVWVVGWRWRHG